MSASQNLKGRWLGEWIEAGATLLIYRLSSPPSLASRCEPTACVASLTPSFHFVSLKTHRDAAEREIENREETKSPARPSYPNPEGSSDV